MKLSSATTFMFSEIALRSVLLLNASEREGEREVEDAAFQAATSMRKGFVGGWGSRIAEEI